MPTISVIVPTYNSQDTIEACLKAVRTSEYTDYELIVVDSASSDSTCSIAERYADTLIRLDERPRRAEARRIAAKRSKGDIIVGVDSDIIVRKKTLSNIAKHLESNDHIDAVTGLLSKEHPNDNFFSQYKNLYMNYIFKKLPDTVTFLFGSIHAIRRRILDLYDSDMGLGEDTAIGQQLTHYGKRIALIKKLEVMHLKKYTFISFTKNNFLIPFYWARLFMQYKGWKQIAKFKTGFAHSSKTQILSLLLAPVIAALLVLGAMDRQMDVLIGLTLLLWFLFNVNFLVFLEKEKGFIFAFRSLFVTFFDNIVMMLGILCGLVAAIRHLR